MGRSVAFFLDLEGEWYVLCRKLKDGRFSLRPRRHTDAASDVGEIVKVRTPEEFVEAMASIYAESGFGHGGSSAKEAFKEAEFSCEWLDSLASLDSEFGERVESFLSSPSEGECIDSGTMESCVGSPRNQALAGPVLPEGASPSAKSPPSLRFEYKAGPSAKFWAVAVRGTVVCLQWGKIGTVGQSKELPFASEGEADAEAKRRMQEKLSDGYVQVLEPAPASPGDRSGREDPGAEPQPPGGDFPEEDASAESRLFPSDPDAWEKVVNTVLVRKPGDLRVDFVNGVGEPLVRFDLCEVPGGTFDIGDTFGDGFTGEEVSAVTISGFYLGKHPVTQEQWVAVMGTNPSHFPGARRPVEQVAWDDVQAFIGALNHKAGHLFRLPTDAEWECAARSGGRQEKWAGTSDEAELHQYAWLRGNSGGQTHPVGQKRPNGLGLYDMTGNVEEWVSDYWCPQRNPLKKPSLNPKGPKDGTTRTRRGGHYDTQPPYSRTPARGAVSPDRRGPTLGFRLAASPVVLEGGGVCLVSTVPNRSAPASPGSPSGGPTPPGGETTRVKGSHEPGADHPHPGLEARAPALDAGAKSAALDPLFRRLRSFRGGGRVARAVQALGFTTLEEVAAAPDEVWLSQPGVGTVSLRSLRAALAGIHRTPAPPERRPGDGSGSRQENVDGAADGPDAGFPRRAQGTSGAPPGAPARGQDDSHRDPPPDDEWDEEDEQRTIEELGKALQGLKEAAETLKGALKELEASELGTAGDKEDTERGLFTRIWRGFRGLWKGRPKE